MHAFFTAFNNKKLFLPFLLGLNLLLHAPFLSYPPCSTHVWRQCHTLAVTRNFYEEDMNIFRPRVDKRLDSDGVTGMHFPAYEFGAASFSKIFGFSEMLVRIYSLVLFSLALIFFHGICLRLTGSEIAASVGTWSLCWSPELFYHSINPLPDDLALCAMLGGWFFFMLWIEKQNAATLLISFLLVSLAGLVKIQFASFLAFAAVFSLLAWRRKKMKTSSFVAVLVACLLSSAIVIAWYIHANHMIVLSGLRDFGIAPVPIPPARETLDILSRNIFSNFPEVLLNYAGTILFVAGVLLLFRDKAIHSRWALPLIAWAFLVAVFHVVETGQMLHHTYYMIVHIPLLLVPVVYAVPFLRRKAPILLLILLLAQPVLAAARIIPARWMKADQSIPTAFFNRSVRAQLEAALPAGRIITGPDPSGCIYLYFLHRKGFGFNFPGDLAEKMPSGRLRIEEDIAQGAQFLITDHPDLLNDSILATHLGPPRALPGNFFLSELK